MADELRGTRIAFLMANEGVEEVELTRPLRALQEAGATVDLLAPEPGEIQAFNHLDRGGRYSVDRVIGSAEPSEYDGLVLPGGVANPDALRTRPEAVDFLRRAVEDGMPAGVICHAPWMLVEAGLVEGRTVTSWPSLRTDIVNAGGTWVDEEVHVDGRLITSRRPDDLPAFCAAIVEAFAEARPGLTGSGSATAGRPESR